MKLKLKLLQNKCHVLEFTKDKAQNASKIIRVFTEIFISHDRHTLFALERVDLLGRPTPVSPSRELSPHRSASLTANPRQRRRKKEEDPHLHTNK
jgi:hypothetical protein